MTCPTCQTENPEGAKFCGKCGALLIQPSQPTQTPQAPQSPPTEEVTLPSPPSKPTPITPERPEVPTPLTISPVPPSKTDGKRILLFVGLGLSFIIILSCGIFLFIRMRRERAEKAGIAPAPTIPSPGPAEMLPQKYSSYASSYGFSFDYPSQWNLTYVDTRPNFTSPESQGVLKNLVVVVAQTEIKNVQGLPNEMRSALSYISDQDIINQQETKLGTLPAYEIEAVHDIPTEPGKRNHVRVVGTIISEKKIFVGLMMGAYSDQYREFEKAFSHIASSFQVTSGAPSSGFRMYALDAFGVYVEYPEQWEIIKISADKIVLHDPAQPEEPKNLALTVAKAPELRSLNDWIEVALESFNNTQGVSILSQGPTTLGNKAAHEIKYRYRVSEDRVDQGWQIGAFDRGVVATLTLAASANTYESLAQQFEAIVNSFRW